MTATATNALLCRLRTAFLKGVLALTLGAAASTAAGAQETLLEEHPYLKERAVVMRIVSRIVEENQQVVWNSENSRVTLPGRPVGLKLVGTNLVVTVQFTPVLRDQGQHVLVAQGQIWINVPGEGMRYHTTIQTIPLEFNEQIFFFPLGSMQARDEAVIEIQLVVEPYSQAFAGRGQGREPRPELDSGAGGEPPPRRWGSIGSPGSP
ncbi:MAG: hypothetical protein FWC64_11145 [Treponema sp.]|nr:hypothetical protein [Treponema sp.]